MAESKENPNSRKKKSWWTNKTWKWGVSFGFFLSVFLVLASGYMVDVTNKDVFCDTCHAMKPFRQSWLMSVHGGQNPQGFRAQCVDCHLPHGDFIQYLTTKAITGTSDVVQNLYIDTAEFDWAGNAEKHREKFTYDSACRHCHANLTPPGLPKGGFIAHRAYLRGGIDKKCVSCHPHVGHKDMIEVANKFFENDSKE